MYSSKLINISFDDLSADQFFAAPENELFRDNQLLAGISDDAYAQLAAKTETVHYKPREIIFAEDDPGDFLYLIAQGSVKISKRGRGGEQETLAFIQPGNFFGEMALLDGQPRSAMATTAESTLLGTVNEETFQQILELAPSRLHMNFLRSVSERLRSVNSHFISEVMRAERLSLVGAMANSIIHDLKNPICIIRCCSDLIAADSGDPRIKELTVMQNKAVEGMLAMTQELLDYARGSTELEKKSISIWRLIQRRYGRWRIAIGFRLT
jgi:CRP-like cAMP-binding protein